MGDMHELPDGSGFFTATIYDKRPPGFVNWLKYTRTPVARGWLLLWRNYRSARQISRWPDQGPPLGHWRCARYAFMVNPCGWRLF